MLSAQRTTANFRLNPRQTQNPSRRLFSLAFFGSGLSFWKHVRQMYNNCVRTVKSLQRKQKTPHLPAHFCVAIVNMCGSKTIRHVIFVIVLTWCISIFVCKRRYSVELIRWFAHRNISIVDWREAWNTVSIISIQILRPWVLYRAAKHILIVIWEHRRLSRLEHCATYK